MYHDTSHKRIRFLAIIFALIVFHIVCFYFEQIKSLSEGSSGEAVSGNPPVMWQVITVLFSAKRRCDKTRCCDAAKPAAAALAHRVKLGSDAVLRFNNGFATILNAWSLWHLWWKQAVLAPTMSVLSRENVGNFIYKVKFAGSSMPGCNVFITDNADDKIKVDD